MKISDANDIQRCYRALVDRSPQHVGAFYAAVKTTGIFCIATCRARKPKLENVDFFTDLKEPLALGFRPCKVCRPTENSPDVPPQVARAVALVREASTRRIPDGELRSLGLSPELIRRWFLKHHGFSFQAYQRMLRINGAMAELKDGRSATEAALGSGYESLSGFAYTFKKMTGHAPSNAAAPLVMHRFSTPLGPMFVCASENGVCLLEFTDRRMLETELRDIQRHFRTRILAGENEHTRETESQLGEYFAGKRTEFSVPLDAPGSAFQTRVWAALRSLPFGEATHYQALAERIGAPSATRAVASANGANRIAIIIPCHRVIGKDGSLTGYGGGLARKEWLLAHEGAR
ncbi:bifunctional transcriptional activator/DNA repair enzyme AdaA [Massilia endophytica]|uniref:bifunctional transcriptional activator/DNA repair enzyme AdaA n=1 Tax=Massilia endophytica TaxID=2899220 RepID=UPI001E2D00F9|nr:methylated-DNA--[protein]-cysteine S-methyltransferase [Massilia endophytica]UGQ47478.1 methylated-DNA--[protein]-cysteine S-methyltransferase [Massilia endophytica]